MNKLKEVKLEQVIIVVLLICIVTVMSYTTTIMIQYADIKRTVIELFDEHLDDYLARRAINEGGETFGESQIDD